MVSTNETLALNLLDEHDSILKKHIVKQDGKIIKHIGDAVFAEFNMVDDAAKAAIERELAETLIDEGVDSYEKYLDKIYGKSSLNYLWEHIKLKKNYHL